jgi:hypothetical protein
LCTSQRPLEGADSGSPAPKRTYFTFGEMTVLREVPIARWPQDFIQKHLGWSIQNEVVLEPKVELEPGTDAAAMVHRLADAAHAVIRAMKPEDADSLLVDHALARLEQALDELPDRLAKSYLISDLARDIEMMAQQLQSAENIFDSSLTDEDIQGIYRMLQDVSRRMADGA